MSGTLTRDQLSTEICDVVGKSTASVSVSGATLQTRVQSYFLNWAQRRIAKSYDFYELMGNQTSAVTVANVKTYPLETGTNNLGLTNVKNINTVVLIDGSNTYRSRRLEFWHPRRFDDMFPRPENYPSDIPSMYIRQGDNLELFRIPDAAYTLKIRYAKWPTVFSSGSQTSDFSNKDELIVTAGVLETYLALEEYADAAIWMQKFVGQLKDSISEEGDPDWEPRAEFFRTDRIPATGKPWLSASGHPDDPMYGYE